MRRTTLNQPMVALSVCAMISAMPSLSAAVTTQYSAQLNQLSNSGVSGQALLTLIDDSSLTVSITATGLEPNMPHAQHIHGLVGTGGVPLNSTSPTLAQDIDHDGFVELAEGQATYGPILVPLTSPPGGNPANFPTAPTGTINFLQTYNLNDPTIYAAGFNKANLLPLDLREIVLHGRTVAAGVGAGTPGEVDGTAGYKGVLPVASGEIVVSTNGTGGGNGAAAVPEPASLGLFGTGLLGLGWLVRRGRIAG
jgi:hypothetical protein